MASKDLAHTLEKSGTVTYITDPGGRRKLVKAIAADIGLTIDPETGLPVSGRTITVSWRMESLSKRMPTGDVRRGSKPWLVEYETIRGDKITAAVVSTMPDLALGILVAKLEIIDD